MPSKIRVDSSWTQAATLFHRRKRQSDNRCIIVVFDDRPTPEWLGYADDPATYQPDCSGTYTVTFQGQATLGSVAGAPTLTFANQSYNAPTIPPQPA